ncbi:MAG: sugar transferase [Rhodobacteraceae bacterium]|nr:sugar transferase [Paracoccaceae bacterium]
MRVDKTAFKHEPLVFFPSTRSTRFEHAKRQALLAGKRAFDILGSLSLLPVMGLTGVTLLLLNPVLNPGPLLYCQIRMGRHCKPFCAIKFRTMAPLCGPETRGAEDPLEQDRIPPLGQLLRKSRIDELPQILNVLRGEMSLIGPRPDAIDHAQHFLRTVPGYRERHALRPGISGLAQVTVGYVEGSEGTRAKVAADLVYISRSSFRLEAKIIGLTLLTILRLRGA